MNAESGRGAHFSSQTTASPKAASHLCVQFICAHRAFAAREQGFRGLVKKNWQSTAARPRFTALRCSIMVNAVPALGSSCGSLQIANLRAKHPNHGARDFSIASNCPIALSAAPRNRFALSETSLRMVLATATVTEAPGFVTVSQFERPKKATFVYRRHQDPGATRLVTAPGRLGSTQFNRAAMPRGLSVRSAIRRTVGCGCRLLPGLRPMWRTTRESSGCTQTRPHAQRPRPRPRAVRSQRPRRSR